MRLVSHSVVRSRLFLHMYLSHDSHFNCVGSLALLAGIQLWLHVTIQHCVSSCKQPEKHSNNKLLSHDFRKLLDEAERH